ncbi:MAG: hypothetical protein PVH50_06925 [Anaerolineae bacterium]
MIFIFDNGRQDAPRLPGDARELAALPERGAGFKFSAQVAERESVLGAIERAARDSAA